MSELNINDLRKELRGIGIIHLADQDRFLDAARKCAKTGLVVGSGWAVLGAPALAPGAAAGFLSGFVTGTLSCVGLSYGAKKMFQDIASGKMDFPD